MQYELWNGATRNLGGAFASEDEALAVVRAAVLGHGKAYAYRLVLAAEDEDSGTITIADGAALVRRAAARTVGGHGR